MPRKKNDDVKEAVIIEEKVRTKKKTETKTKEKVEKEEIRNTQQRKSYFFPRFVAYILDVLLVSIVCTGISFFLPENENYNKYMDEYELIQTQYMEQEITATEYLNKSMDVIYDIDYSNFLFIIIEVVLIILYFIVFQFYNKGQTFGKKLMKLRVVSTVNDNLSVNQVAVRALIINSVFANVLLIGSLLFVGRDYYYYANSVIQAISLGVTLTAVVMVLFRKDGRGLHDMLANTQVIQEEV